MSNFKERFSLVLDHLNISNYRIALDLSMSKSTIGNYRSGTSSPNSAKMDALVEYLNRKGVSVQWLLTGKGEMMQDQHNSYSKEKQTGGEEKEESNTSLISEKPENIDNPKVSKNKGVPYFDVDFIGGFDLVMDNQSVNPAFYIDFQPFNDADCWVNISGESMNPIISHGDIVALKKIKSWDEFLLMGEVYAIVTPEFRTVKRLTKGETPDNYTLVPYSKDPVFAEQQIPKHLISHIFKVKGSIKKFF